MKERLDILLFNRKLTQSREKARILIMEGLVYVDNQKSDKPGSLHNVNSKIEIRENKIKYVSRGGLKLEKAIQKFNIDLTNLNCMDIGASTGGFTDCMLQNNCNVVYSVDVGYGQLDWKLRNNSKVINLERTNIRYLDASLIKHEINFFSVDVSFISLKLVLPVIKNIINYGVSGVCLIKPQFEAGREKVGKKGVVKDINTHEEVINNICEFCLKNEFDILNLDYSPIKGPEGNIEYLIHIKKSHDTYINSNIDISNIVKKSHEEL